MKQRFQFVPFRDPQDQPAARRCRVCGREIYTPDGKCLYCLVYGP